ncbi:MAG TPA: sulfotransferase [Rhizomicrobium sp.]
MAPTPGPDFLCLGMAKAGTGWLGDQLRFHPQFWIPVQELGYLDRERPPLQVAKKRLERLRKQSERKHPAPARPLDPRDLTFLEEIYASAGKPRDLDVYIAAFRHKGESKTGDISPGYVMMDGAVAAELCEKLPHLRIVLLLREPLDRAWSHLSMWSRVNKFNPEILEKPERFRSYLQRQQMTGERAFPTRLVEHWSKHIPEGRFRYFFFDDIAKRPEEARREIFTFIGGDPNISSGELAAGYNRKADSKKLEMTPEIRTVLLDHFAGELRACAALGEPATGWARRYGL